MAFQIACPKCGCINYTKDEKCWKCKRVIADSEKAFAINQEKLIKIKRNEELLNLVNLAKESGDWTALTNSDLKILSEKVKVVTSPSLFNGESLEVKGLVAAQVVYGSNFIKDLFASVRDLVGGRSESIEKILKDAREEAISEMKIEAFKCNANAVLSVNFDYQELSAGEKYGMYMLAAAGTAVFAKELES